MYIYYAVDSLSRKQRHIWITTADRDFTLVALDPNLFLFTWTAYSTDSADFPGRYQPNYGARSQETTSSLRTGSTSSWSTAPWVYSAPWRKKRLLSESEEKRNYEMQKGESKVKQEIILEGEGTYEMQGENPVKQEILLFA